MSYIDEIELGQMLDEIKAAAKPGSPEELSLRRGEAMFDFLVNRDAWLGCRDWDGLSPRIQAAFIDMASLYTSPVLAAGVEDSSDKEG